MPRAENRWAKLKLEATGKCEVPALQLTRLTPLPPHNSRKLWGVRRRLQGWQNWRLPADGDPKRGGTGSLERPEIIIVILIATIYCFLCGRGNWGHLINEAISLDPSNWTGGWAFLTVQPERQSCPRGVRWLIRNAKVG